MSDTSRGLHPLLFIFGSKRVALPRAQLEAMLSLCIARHISYRGIELDGALAYISLPFWSSSFIKEATASGIDIKQCENIGLPALLIKHRRRIGLPIGVILGILLLFTSGRVLWDVRIEGALRLDSEQVEELLAECGLSVGSKKSSLDVSVIENRVLILSDDIAWISINIRGTVANVEIRELDMAEPPEEEPIASNLVAAAGGVIARLEDIKGNIAVDIGDTVSQGQLLVGGIYGDESVGIGYTAASGRVYAQCEEVLSVEIPRAFRKKVYTGSVKYEKYLIFFKKEIKFFGNGGNSPASCDKIDTVEYFSSPGGDDLPIGIRTVRYMEYTYEDAEHTDEELSRIAEEHMELSLAKLLGDGELLRKSSSFELNSKGYRLQCHIKCIRNIAREQEIEILP